MNDDLAPNQMRSLADYLAVLERRKWMILQAVVIVPVAAVLISLQQQKVYAATAEVLLSRSNLGMAVLGVDDSSPWQDPGRQSQTQAELARVPSLAQRVVASVPGSGRTAADLLDSSTVEPQTDADLLSFRVEDTDPVLAARLASAYAREFTEFKQEFDTGRLRQARQNVERQIRDLRREGASDSSQVLRSLLESRNELQTLEALQGESAIVLEEPRRGGQVTPNPRRNGFLGLGLGLLLGVGLAFMAEALDRRVRSETEVESALDIPLLARIPPPPRSLRRKDQLIMLAEPSATDAEPFRKLRTNVEFAMLSREARTIMVTSAVEREGKSTTVANLAIAFARAGKRVLLVDLDLRQPSVDKLFRLTNRTGITNVVVGAAALEDAITSVTLPLDASPRTRIAATNGGRVGERAVAGVLDVLPAGTLPPSPGEFISTDAFARTFSHLSEQADIVLIDTPPLLIVGDGLSLSAHVDALFVVTRLSVLRRPMLRELARVLEKSPATKLGFVMSNSDQVVEYEYGGYYPSVRETRERERESAR